MELTNICNPASRILKWRNIEFHFHHIERLDIKEDWGNLWMQADQIHEFDMSWQLGDIWLQSNFEQREVPVQTYLYEGIMP